MAAQQQKQQGQRHGGSGHGSGGSAHTDKNAPPYDITARTSEVSHMGLVVPLLAVLFLSAIMAVIWSRFGARYAPAQQQMRQQYGTPDSTGPGATVSGANVQQGSEGDP